MSLPTGQKTVAYKADVIWQKSDIANGMSEAEAISDVPLTWLEWGKVATLTWLEWGKVANLRHRGSQ
jgi:hypothetical protein